LRGKSPLRRPVHGRFDPFTSCCETSRARRSSASTAARSARSRWRRPSIGASPATSCATPTAFWRRCSKTP